MSNRQKGAENIRSLFLHTRNVVNNVALQKQTYEENVNLKITSCKEGNRVIIYLSENKQKGYTMKKIIAAAATLAIAASCMTACGNDEAEQRKDLLTMSRTSMTIVTDVNKHDITVTDEEGHMWGFLGNGYNMGDLVILTLNDNGTPDNITDDIIERAAIVR